MADPVLIPCPVDVWTKIASGVTGGLVHQITTKPDKYLQTYREVALGNPAPVDGEIEEGVPIFKGDDVEDISFKADADVYITCIGAAGLLRVDL